MKRLLSFTASGVLVGAPVLTAVLLIALAPPAEAQSGPSCQPPAPGQTTNCTFLESDVVLRPMTVTPIQCPDGSVVPGGTLEATIENGVFHITVDAAGDFWITTTIEGTFTFIAAPSGTVYNGNFMNWFGVEANNLNSVDLGNLTFVGTSAPGSTLSLHLVFHISVSATGQLTMFMNAVC
jgi:hypothetical protein